MSALDTTPGRMSTLAGMLSDLAQPAIKERGGADCMYANDPAKLASANLWVEQARPVIMAMFAMEDAAQPLASIRLADPNGYVSYSKMSPQSRVCEEAQGYIKTARKALFEMLDGVRDSFLCDERVGCYDGDDQEEADAFNDWLDDETVTVDAAIRMIENEIADEYAAIWEPAA